MYEGEWSCEAHPSHWAQLKIYAGLLGEKGETGVLELHLTYLELESRQVVSLRESMTAAQALGFLNDTRQVYLDWMEVEVRWLAKRDASIAALPFPHGAYREGQLSERQQEFASAKSVKSRRRCTTL